MCVYELMSDTERTRNTRIDLLRIQLIDQIVRIRFLGFRTYR